MIKIFSAVIIIAVCGLVGILVANNFKLRPWQLRQLQAGMQMLETEIAYAATPLPEALEKIARQLQHPLNKLFEISGEALMSRDSFSVRDSWQKGIKELAEISALTDKDLALLENLGHNLGLSDREEQIKHLRLTKEQLKHHELVAEEEKAKGEKIWRYCGFLTGLLIVLLII
jgi:stage III sporulation protein AB